jgi:hypothetical protein
VKENVWNTGRTTGQESKVLYIGIRCGGIVNINVGLVFDN